MSINQMIPVFDQRAQVLLDKWNQRLSGSQTNELHMNLAKELFGVTLDIIGLVGFGHNFDMTRSEHANKFAESFTQIMMGVRDLFIWIMALRRLAPYLPLPVNRKREMNMDVFRSLLFPIIAEKREQAETRIRDNVTEDVADGKRKDLMDRLIEAYLRESSSGKRPLTDEELIGHVLTFAFAGHETVCCFPIHHGELFILTFVLCVRQTATGMGWAVRPCPTVGACIIQLTFVRIAGLRFVIAPRYRAQTS